MQSRQGSVLLVILGGLGAFLDPTKSSLKCLYYTQDVGVEMCGGDCGCDDLHSFPKSSDDDVWEHSLKSKYLTVGMLLM